MSRVSVVKIGGSLLASPELPRRLRNWLAAESAAHPDTHFVLLVGGGKLVDAIRRVHARSPLDEEAAHWSCIELMGVTAGLVRAMLPEIALESEFATLEQRRRKPGVTLLQPLQFLKQVEPTRAGTRLTADWSVTSDAIAGRLAVVLGAAELVLVKSVPPSVPIGGQDWLQQLAAAGFIDDFLPSLSAELPPVRFATLD